MTKHLLLFALPGLFACTTARVTPESAAAVPPRSTGPAEPLPEGTRFEGIERAVLAAPIDTISFEPVVGPPASSRIPTRREGELSIWDDSSFKERFAQSYLAKTDVEPIVTETERAQLFEIFELISEDKLEKALRLLEKHGGPAASAAFDAMEGNVYYQQDDFARAKELYGVAVDKYPKFLRAWEGIAQIHFREGEYAKALPALVKVIELGGGDGLMYGLLGLAHANAGNNLAAESAFRMASLLDPENLDWFKGMADSFFKQGRFAEAAALCQTLIRDHPDRSEFWLLQANAFIQLGKPLKAAENYELVDRIGGSSPASLNNLGDIYINEGLYDQAVSAYVRALSQDEAKATPDHAIRAAGALADRAAFPPTRMLLDEVDARFEGTLDDTKRTNVLRLRARVALAEGAGDEEARVLEEIVALDPTDGQALILLGMHSGRNGDVEQAIFYFERAAALERFEAEAKQKHGQLLAGEGRYSEALPLLKRSQQLDERDYMQKYIDEIERLAGR